MNGTPKIQISNLHLSYGGHTVLSGIDAVFSEGGITAITGPSGRGKSSFLTVLNRLWESVPGAHVTGSVLIRFGNDLEDIHAPSFNVPRLRRKVGMVFQIPNPLPMSIYRNIAFPLKLGGITNPSTVTERVEQALSKSHLWNEVKDRLSDDARSLSGGQQQRLCVARALINDPDILLLDEPTSSLDENAAAGIEDLMIELKMQRTLIVVSHYMDQVRRIADRVISLKDGRFVEENPSLKNL
jgi:phosphate transport system ATP-binding protein